MSDWATQNKLKWDLWVFLFIYFVPHFYFLGFLSFAILQTDKYLFLSKYLSNAYVLYFEKGNLNFRFFFFFTITVLLMSHKWFRVWG